MYLGELARLVLVHAVREGVAFPGRMREVLAVLGKRDAFESRYATVPYLGTGSRRYFFGGVKSFLVGWWGVGVGKFFLRAI